DRAAAAAIVATGLGRRRDQLGLGLGGRRRLWRLIRLVEERIVAQGGRARPLAGGRLARAPRARGLLAAFAPGRAFALRRLAARRALATGRTLAAFATLGTLGTLAALPDHRPHVERHRFQFPLDQLLDVGEQALVVAAAHQRQRHA